MQANPNKLRSPAAPSVASAAHTDHAVARSRKSTQLGLAPVFEALPDDALEEERTIQAPGKPPPPPPPQLRRSAPPPLFEEDDDLATALEGATMIAPAHSTDHGIPAWVQGLLLFTIIAGVGVAAWLLWSGADTPAPPTGDADAPSLPEVQECEARMMQRLRSCGLELEAAAERTCVTTPSEWNRLFPGTGGSLYGRNAHGWRASFQRPGPRTRIPRLYLAGGCTHPGPGVPMAALSGGFAAASVAADLAAS